jgi:hypothetical protein
MQRGFQAIAFKAIDPIQSVQAILESGFSHVIMNHRLHEKTGLGHYTVAISATEEVIEFHDPEYGPSQKQSPATMRALWLPKFPLCEITGNFIVAIAPAPIHHICKTCGLQLLEKIQCPVCLLSFSLQPVSALGCTNDACNSKFWELILCPYCDSAFKFRLVV